MKIALVFLTLLAACGGPPDDLSTNAVATIQQPHIWPTRSVKISLKVHYRYHPEADVDLTTAAGQAEVSPTILPQTYKNHAANQWYGFPDIQQVSPIMQLAWSAYTQKNNANPGEWINVGYGTVSCLPTLGIANGINGVGLAAIDCTGNTAFFDQVNETFMVQWTPVCRNGALGNGWSTEISTGYNDPRVRAYDVPGGTSVVISVDHGSPYYERSYWQTMAINCGASPSIFTAHPGPWTHPMWQLHCVFGGCYLELDWLGGPYNWN